MYSSKTFLPLLPPELPPPDFPQPAVPSITNAAKPSDNNFNALFFILISFSYVCYFFAVIFIKALQIFLKSIFAFTAGALEPCRISARNAASLNSGNQLSLTEEVKNNKRQYCQYNRRVYNYGLIKVSAPLLLYSAY